MARQQAFKTKRSLGQVFLKDMKPVTVMVQSLLELGIKRVVEIGPGPGALTKGLLAGGLHVIAVEKDDVLFENLEDNLLGRGVKEEELGRLQKIHADILEVDFDRLFSEHQPEGICGNIPYNISSPIVQKSIQLFQSRTDVKGSIFLTQAEFAQRLCAVPRTKDYSSLSVFVQLHSYAQSILRVSPRSFEPIPKVWSELIKLTPRDPLGTPLELQRAERASRLAFGHRRKMLRQSLKDALPPLSSCPIDLTRRPEELDLKEWLRLGDYMYGQSNMM